MADANWKKGDGFNIDSSGDDDDDDQWWFQDFMLFDREFVENFIDISDRKIPRILGKYTDINNKYVYQYI